MSISRTLLVAAALAGAALLSGCATNAASNAGSAPAPDSSSPAADAATARGVALPNKLAAGWLGADAIALVLPGELCDSQIADIVAGAQTLDLTFTSADSGKKCADPSTPFGEYVGIPAGLDTSKDLTLTVTDADGQKSDVVLVGYASGSVIPADNMASMTPAVSWVSADTLAVLTWGSSTCPPNGGEVALGADGASATITLGAPTSKQCTMDLRPTLTFVDAAGADTSAMFTLEGFVDDKGETVMITAVAPPAA